MNMKFAIIIPTYNGEKAGIEDLLKSIKEQSIKPERIYIIDSSSKDKTVEICRQYGCTVDIISSADFNHGLTRQQAVDKNKDCDIAVIMTQDVVLENKDTLKTLISSFNIQDVSAAYGRQLVKTDSSFIEKISRTFNYPENSILKSKENIKELGLSAAFCSDSFSAYNIKDLINAGGFPKTDFAEDMLVAAKLILNGKKIHYNAAAKVYHSHPYSIRGEYLRGKAIGQMHKENPWLISNFGKAENRGKALLKSLPLHKKLLYIIQALPKLAGYKLSK